MPFSYSSEFRVKVLEQIRAGRSVAVLARELGMAESTLYRWKRQDRVDQGLAAGTSSFEGAQLQAARRRIKELEAELAAVKRASELFGEDRVMRPKDLYPIVEALGAEGHGLKASCGLLGVSASGFFYWRARPMPASAVRRAWLADVVAEIWVRSRHTYGWRRVQAELAEVYGHRASRNLALSVMREQHISGLPRRKSRRRDLSRAHTAADLVNREFDRDGPNQLWMTDITEHPTREGKLYVRAVLDAWSRKVVGWSIDRRQTTAMVNSALAMAIDSRRPRPGAVVHSDPRHPIHILGVQPATPKSKPRAVTGHSGRRVRQRRGRIVLGASADRAAEHQEMEDPHRAVHRDIRLDRDILQLDPATLIARQHLTRRVRETPTTTTTRRLTPANRDQQTGDTSPGPN